MADAAERQFDAVMNQAFAMRPLAGAHFIEQSHRSFLQQSGADTAEHIVRGLALQNDVVDAMAVQQLPEQQSRRSRANDCYFCPQYLLLRLL